MPIKAMCPECQTQYSVPDAAAGKKIKCRACEFVFPVAQPRPAATPKSEAPRNSRESDEDVPLLTPVRKEKRLDALPPKIVKPKKSTYLASDDDEDDDDEPTSRRRRQRSPDETDPRLMILAIALGVAALGAVSFFAVQLRRGQNAIVQALNAAGAANVEDVEDPEDVPFLKAARPFADAIAAKNYEAAFAELSPLARANAYHDQFVPAGENEQLRKAVGPLTLESFKELMAESEKVLGSPKKLDHIYVDSRDPELLSGRGDALERMFVMGGTPDAIPGSARRAALRGQIIVRHPHFPENAEEGEEPYLNLRIILTEEDGKLGVGYFDLGPPSILD